MHILSSWRALLVREYLEHRMSFVYFPIGIVTLLAISGASALTLRRVTVLNDMVVPGALKVFEVGYLLLFALWMAYLAVALFFYFGDAFSADRRNNAMLFWKSMPVTDLKVLTGKYLSGSLMFPAIILVMGMITGVIFYLILNVAAYVVPVLGYVDPMGALNAFGQITLFAAIYFVLALLWYAPFLAWVGGLSTVVGRWSLPLAFVIPGLLIVLENIAFFGNVPQGGYIWRYISSRFNFGLTEPDVTLIAMDPRRFDALRFADRLLAHVNWVQMGVGLAFAAIVIWLASEYRRRRIA